MDPIQNQPNIPSPEIAEVPPTSHKLLWSATIVLALALTAGGYTWFKISKTPNFTGLEQKNSLSDWQTYRNEKYGFKFKYPPELTYKEIKEPSTLSPYIEQVDIHFYDREELAFFIYLNKDAFDYGAGTCDEDLIESTIIINGISMIRRDSCGEIIYTIKYPGKSFFWPQFNYDQQKFEQIVSTFKFIYKTTVYFKQDTPESEIVSFKELLQKQTGAASVTYMSSDEALSYFKERHKNDPVVLEALNELADNPFQAILVIETDTEKKETIINFIKSQVIYSKIEKII